MKKLLYWLGQITWGALLTIPGLFVFIFCIIFTKAKYHRNGYSIIIEIGNNWGGLNLGAISLCGGYTTTYPDIEWFEHTRRHEFGHSLQNLIFGPFQLFIVVIPSVIRYWYFTYREAKDLPTKDYDSIWFEGTATRWGTKFIDKIEK